MTSDQPTRKLLKRFLRSDGPGQPTAGLPMGIKRMGSQLEMISNHAASRRRRLGGKARPDFTLIDACSKGLQKERKLNFGSQFGGPGGRVVGLASKILLILDRGADSLCARLHYTHRDIDNGKFFGFSVDEMALKIVEMHDELSDYHDEHSFISLTTYAHLLHSLRQSGNESLRLVCTLMEIKGRERDIRGKHNYFVRALELLDDSVYPSVVRLDGTIAKMHPVHSERSYENLPKIKPRVFKRIERLVNEFVRNPIMDDLSDIEYMASKLLFLMRATNALKRETSASLRDASSDCLAFCDKDEDEDEDEDEDGEECYYSDDDEDDEEVPPRPPRYELKGLEDEMVRMVRHLLAAWEEH